MTWHFRAQQPGDPTRDPIVGEFFATDAIENPAEALIREGIQNSLDASIGETVKVRVLLAGPEFALPAERANRWFEGAWPHFRAAKNGLRNPPGSTENCPYLVFEDFGTTGLKGDVRQAFDEEGIKNLFFYFFRAEGRSPKGESDRGRWGVGKHVFPRSSSTSSIFGLTIRSDDSKRLLLGHSILKSHVLNSVHYTPDGYFGQLPAPLVLPFDDAQTLDEFSDDFRLARKHEPGLSLVVPYIDSEFTADFLKTAVITGYFVPILKGTLSVTIATPTEEEIIDAEHLVDVALRLKVPNVAEILHLVDLAEWSSTKGIHELVHLSPCSPDRPAWDDSLIPPANLPDLKNKLESGARLAIRAHLTVREKGKPPVPSHFDIFLKNDGYESGRPIFVREGIIVSDVRAARTRGIRSLVVIDDPPLASLLGDSENPAHTQWQRDSSNFKGKFIFGPAYIEFVMRAAHNLVSALRAQDAEENKAILVDLFSLPVDDVSAPQRPDLKVKPRPKPGDDSSDDFPSIEPRRKRFRILRVPGGFSIAKGDAGTSPPSTLSIRVAYDVRKGSPLKKYDPSDFRVEKAPIQMSPGLQGLEVTECLENRIELAITDPDFRFSISGFDQQRDLFVSVRMEEGTDASEA